MDNSLQNSPRGASRDSREMPRGTSFVLPWHPHPEKDEVFSSWFLRFASGYGLTANELSRRIGISLPEIDDWHQGVKLATRRYAAIAALKTGLPVSDLRRMLVCELEGLVPQNKYESPSKDEDTWITRFVLGRRLHFFGEFCPLCLSTHYPYSLNWKISLFVSCPVHRCLLSGRCESCGKRFAGLKHLYSVDLSNRLNLMKSCPSCSVSLGNDTSTTPVLPEVGELEEVHRHLIRERSCFSYFSLWYLLLNDLIHALRWKGFEDRTLLSRVDWDESTAGTKGPMRFEMCSPIQREHLVRAVMNIFREWPRALLDVAGCCTTYYWLDRLPISLVPKWFRDAAELACNMGSHSLQSVQDSFWSSAETQGWIEAAKLLSEPSIRRHTSQSCVVA